MGPSALPVGRAHPQVHLDHCLAGLPLLLGLSAHPAPRPLLPLALLLLLLTVLPLTDGLLLPSGRRSLSPPSLGPPGRKDQYSVRVL